MKFGPHRYQLRAIDHVLEHPASGLLLDMGLGKSVITLTAVERLMYDSLEVSRVLVIAPKRVAETTWTDECAKWDHLRHLSVSRVLGDRENRKRALNTPADIYVINRENVEWLCGHCGKKWPFDMVVIDELSSFKNPQAKRFKALRKVRPFIRRIVGLTGTPSPNGLMDLWAQIYLLDMGERLGRTIGAYRSAFFRPGMTNGQVVYNWIPNAGSERVITDRISDICISMTAEDYLSLPDLMVIDYPVRMTVEAMKAYRDFVRELVLEVGGKEITAQTAASLTGKLQQYVGGAVYTGELDFWTPVWRGKTDELHEIVEQADGPVLVYYSYKHELARILVALEQFHPEVLDGPESVERWNRGQIRVLLAHPASAGYGLNLQAGGSVIVWYSLTWSCELYMQANARLHRQGQTKPVRLYRLLCPGTIDDKIVRALEGKRRVQDAVMEAVKDIVELCTDQ